MKVGTLLGNARPLPSLLSRYRPQTCLPTRPFWCTTTEKSSIPERKTPLQDGEEMCNIYGVDSKRVAALPLVEPTPKSSRRRARAFAVVESRGEDWRGYFGEESRLRKPRPQGEKTDPRVRRLIYRLSNMREAHGPIALRVLGEAQAWEPPMGKIPVQVFTHALRAVARLGDLRMLRRMLAETRTPRLQTEGMFHELLFEFSLTGNTAVAWCIREEMARAGVAMKGAQASLLITGHLRAGTVEMALEGWREAIEQTPLPNGPVWALLIRRLCAVREAEMALEVAEKSVDLHVQFPREVERSDRFSVWESVLIACGRRKHVEGMRRAFREAVKDPRWVIHPFTARSTLRLLGDLGEVELSSDVFTAVGPIRADPELWGLLVRSSLVAKNISVATGMIDRALRYLQEGEGVIEDSIATFMETVAHSPSSLPGMGEEIQGNLRLAVADAKGGSYAHAMASAYRFSENVVGEADLMMDKSVDEMMDSTVNETVEATADGVTDEAPMVSWMYTGKRIK